MKPQYIERAWKTFEAMCVPPSAGDVQRTEMRNAFFAGSGTLFRIIVGRLEGGEEPTEADLKMLDDINEELSEFGRRLDQRVFAMHGRG